MICENHEVIFPNVCRMGGPILETNVESEASYFQKNVEKLEGEQSIAQRLIKELENWT